MTGKLVAAIAAAGMLLTGCSGGSTASSGDVQADQATATASSSATPSTQTSPSAKAAGGLKITEVGFGKSGDYVTAVAVILNGTDQISSLQVSFAAYDAAGEVLGQQETSAPIARAGATVATTTPIEIKSGKVAKVTAEVNVLQKEKDEHPSSAFVASGVKYRPGEYDASVTGKITSKYDQDVKDAYVAAVCRSAAGKIVGGGEDYYTVKAGGSTAVQVSVSGAGMKSCQLYPTLGGASSAS
ncbi:hypothetical protein [Kribbella sp. VKM Ac-2568]|uniref:hypothetical protein n=1 Tax=Kribbella sp. VKM Ac-2568 TaxID=2512219 RepID=UPI00104AA18A|nr:hypothetical protein [Kribbella sp. VKM Ac-2568]TCM33681.1 hypothetical protein EV648_1303 [Kribbella sp. VKM Ac-2568]